MSAFRGQNKNAVSDCESETNNQYLESLLMENHYICQACYKYVSDNDLNIHHSKHHPEIRVDINIFELLDTTDAVEMVTGNENVNQNDDSNVIANQLYKCGVCSQDVIDFELNDHHFEHHPDIPLDVDIYEPNANQNQLNTEPENAVKSMPTKSQQYVCRECIDNVPDELLDHHHTRRHSNIPMDVNIYDIFFM